MGNVAGVFLPEVRAGVSLEEYGAKMLEVVASRPSDKEYSCSASSVWLGAAVRQTYPCDGTEPNAFVTYIYGNQYGITFDGHLHNVNELKRKFGEISGEGNLRLLLRAYVQIGPKVLEHLDGDFVFAIWDSKNSTLFCARDPLGIRPFYYSQKDGFFAFGSQCKQLLTLPWLKRTPDRGTLARFLALLWDDLGSFFNDLILLPPGHMLVVSCSGLHLGNYWPGGKLNAIHLPSPRDYHDELRSRFLASVLNRLPSSSGTGISLSGGLDSGAIMCQIEDMYKKKKITKRAIAFTNVFDSYERMDERSFVDDIKSLYGSDHVYIKSDDCYALRGGIDEDPLPDNPWYIPFANNHRRIYSAARERNCNVVLWGVGGDQTLVGSIHALTDWARQWDWPQLYLVAVKHAGKRRKEMLARVLYGHLPCASRQWYERNVLSKFPHPAAFLPEYLNPALLKEARIQERIAARNVGPTLGDQYPWLAGARVHQVVTGQTTSLTLPALERTAGEFGIELRYPFLDRKLVEFVIQSPPGIIMNEKRALRESMQDIMPRSIITRKKTSSLRPLLVNGMIENQVQIRGLLEKSVAAEFGLIDSAAAGSGFDDLLANRTFADGWSSYWLLVGVECWLRKVEGIPIPKFSQGIVRPHLSYSDQ